MDETEQAIHAAWLSVNIYHLRLRNSDTFLRAKGWIQDGGRWISPYDGRHKPIGAAMHYERHLARENLEKALLAIGKPVLAKGPYHELRAKDIEALATPAIEGAGNLAPVG